MVAVIVVAVVVRDKFFAPLLRLYLCLPTAHVLVPVIVINNSWPTRLPGGGTSRDLTVFCGAKRNPENVTKKLAGKTDTSERTEVSHSKSKCFHFLPLFF